MVRLPQLWGQAQEGDVTPIERKQRDDNRN